MIKLCDAPPGAALFGPSITLPAGRYIAQLCFRAGQDLRGHGLIDVCVKSGTEILATNPIDADVPPKEDFRVELEVISAEELQDLEVPLWCSNGLPPEGGS